MVCTWKHNVIPAFVKIIDVYRVQILRDHLIVEIDGETIDSKTIDQIYKKYTQDEDLEKLNKLKFGDKPSILKLSKKLSWKVCP